ncbi:membrane protein [Cotonvirus japonicus]|uniref:Membrane protein n=1 Tax=Cotonvirus japonicus TaxID=2811091 RepID=A0ABM7NSG7_9VIRU|nr:membrane protein [Cotonvirus japonicus]BCS83104.1 membrane protein [Cotonvirus japonicus]
MDYLHSNLFLIPIGIGTSYVYLNFKHQENTILSNIVLFLTFMYFFIDFLLMIKWYKPKNNVYFIHHTIGMMSLYICYFHYNHMLEYIFAYLMFELSTPFLNIALHYKKHNINNIFTLINQLIFMIIFIIVRIFFGSYLLFVTSIKIINIGHPAHYLVFLPIVLQVMNFWWFYKIIRIFMYKLQKQKVSTD